MPLIRTRLQPAGPELAHATLAAVVAVAVALLADRFLGFRDHSLIFLTAVIVVAVRTRVTVAIYAAVLCFLAYNFFFIQPRYTLYIAGPAGVATVFMFLAAALVCGQLASRLRSRLTEVQESNSRMQVMVALSQRLAVAGVEDDVADAALEILPAAIGAQLILALVDAGTGKLDTPRVVPEGLQFDLLTRIAAQACLAAAGGSTEARPSRLDFDWWCFPLVAADQRLGVMCLRFEEPMSSIPSPLNVLAQLMVHSIAQALARAKLSVQLEQSRVFAESERLRAALLSSVSHDLRSPLSTIIGSAESLKLYNDRLSMEDRATLAADIVSEGLRLDRYIQNLLDMTRLGQVGPMLQREWVGLDELCGAVIPRIRKLNALRRVQLRLGTSAPLLYVNPGLMEQVLFNLLENAVKFSSDAEPLTVASFRDGDDLVIDVIDRGSGISEVDRAQVFDMFYSVGQGDRSSPGTGLGLTICQGVVSAHGGTIQALPGDDGVGARMRIRLPFQCTPSKSRIGT